MSVRLTRGFGNFNLHLGFCKILIWYLLVAGGFNFLGLLLLGGEVFWKVRIEFKHFYFSIVKENSKMVSLVKLVKLVKLVQLVTLVKPRLCKTNVSKIVKIVKQVMKLKQDQGSKAPSRDHPNSTFMTRLDYIRLED